MPESHDMEPIASSLSPADAEILDAILAARAGSPVALDPARAERAERMARLLALLEACPVEDPGPDLVDRTLAQVRAARQREAEQRMRFARQIEDLSGPALSFGWHEAAALAASLLIVAVLALPMLARNKAEARRVACAASMQAAGAAFQAYAADHEQMLPRGPAKPGQTWFHVGSQPTAGEPFQSNSQHLRLLIGGRYIDPRTFTCAANPHTPRKDDADAVDWACHEQVPFSYQNQFTERPLNLAVSPGMVILADKNPLFIIRPGQPLTLRPGVRPDAPTTYQRLQVHMDGQNILAADGTVSWRTSPIMSNGDNIWSVLGVNTYRGDEMPTTPDDSHLIP